jgi:hypothetical protein
MSPQPSSIFGCLYINQQLTKLYDSVRGVWVRGLWQDEDGRVWERLSEPDHESSKLKPRLDQLPNPESP